MSLLSINNLHLHYATNSEPLKAVNGVSLELQEGEALGIVGESGSGKTSLSLALIRLLPKNIARLSGEIFIGTQNSFDMEESEFRRTIRWKILSMVFQGSMNSLNPVIKVGRQIEEPIELDESFDKSAINERVSTLLNMVNLPQEVRNRYPHELSGGMKQRIMIAMALVMNPKLIILDEPTSALDVSIQAQMMNIFKDLKWEHGTSFIFITHDIGLASDLSDKIAVMYAGKIVESGNAEDVLHNPQHPYTQKLLNSVPDLHSETEPKFIEGEPPNMTTPPSGCSFHPRCDFATEKCINEDPVKFEMGKGHKVFCWLMDGKS